MTAKQQIATGLLAALIICSVAFMPANADSATPVKASSRSHPAVMAAKVSAPESTHESSKDLTYN